VVIGLVFSQGAEPICQKCETQEGSSYSTDRSASSNQSEGLADAGNRSQPKHCSCSCHHVCAAAVIVANVQKIVLFDKTPEALEAPVVFVPGGIVEGIERPPRA